MSRRVSHCSRQHLHLGKPLGGDNPMLRQMAAQCVDQLGSLPHQQVARPKDHRSRLLLFRLHRHKAHRWPGGRLGDRFGVSGVVLLAAHKRLDVNRWNEPHVVPETADGPSPLMRRRARFHRHDGRAAA